MSAPILPGGLPEACNADPSAFAFLRQSQNLVFEFNDRTGTPRILRLTAESHRTEAEIAGELSWVQSLHRHGLSVCPPTPLQDGSLIRTVEIDSEPHHAVVFERARGKPVESGDLGDDLSFRHGEMLGAVHASPFDLTGRKPWPQERYFGPDIEAFVPEEWRTAVRDRCRALLAEAQGFEGPHGPLHFDLGYSNFFLHEGRLQVFDFDNCALGPLVGDVAAALYSSIFTAQRRAPGADRSCFEPPQTGVNLESVWAPFLEGYRSKNEWPDAWSKQLSTWFQVMYLRSVVHAFRLLHPLTPETKGLLEGDIAHLKAGTIPLEFDFQAGRAIV